MCISNPLRKVCKGWDRMDCGSAILIIGMFLRVRLSTVTTMPFVIDSLTLFITKIAYRIA